MDDRNDRSGGKRDRLSWAEIDKIRDKSKSRERDPMQKQSSPAAMNAQKSYRAALERAFASGKVDELAKNLVRPTTVQESRPTHVGGLGALGGGAPPPAAVAASPGVTVTETDPSAGPAAADTPASVASAPKDPDREQKQKLLGKIREAEGREAVSRSIDGFLSKYPKLPDDVEILTKALGHRNDDRVRETLGQLDTICTRDKPRRARTLVAQLRILEDTHSDPDIRAHAGRVRARL